jgi:hypothetical protein
MDILAQIRIAYADALIEIVSICSAQRSSGSEKERITIVGLLVYLHLFP